MLHYEICKYCKVLANCKLKYYRISQSVLPGSLSSLDGAVASCWIELGCPAAFLKALLCKGCVLSARVLLISFAIPFLPPQCSAWGMF